MKIGTPLIKLKPKGTAKAQGKHGAVDKLLREMYETRETASVTYDSDKSVDNQYSYPADCKNVDDTIAWIEDGYNTHWRKKNGDAKPRKDACYGFTGLIKPPAEGMNSMSKLDAAKFMRDALNCYWDICEEHNIEIDGWALHNDEEGPHIHVIGHSLTYKTRDFHDQGFKIALNRKLPRMMRDLGHTDVEDCVRDWSKPRETYGKDVNTYRRRKIKAQTDKFKDDALEARKEAAKAVEELARTKEELAKQQELLKLTMTSINNAKIELNKERQQLDDDIANFEGRKDERRKSRNSRADETVRKTCSTLESKFSFMQFGE